MTQPCHNLPEPCLHHFHPSSDQDTQNVCSFETVKPWFFKPRKSKYGLEDDLRKIKKYNALHWSDEENKKYVQFLKGFLKLINGDTLQKRKYHLNRMLSKHIGTRSPIQCRSHHQKMMKVYKTPEAIISHFDHSPAFHDLNSNLLMESSTALNLENSSTPLFDNLETYDKNDGSLKCPKLKVFYECHLNAKVEASLWDVLTYPKGEDSFNDL